MILGGISGYFGPKGIGICGGRKSDWQSAEWGAMISTGRQYILSHWWYPTFPGIAILITVLGFNLIGDGLRDFLDPKTKK